MRKGEKDGWYQDGMVQRWEKGMVGTWESGKV